MTQHTISKSQSNFSQNATRIVVIDDRPLAYEMLQVALKKESDLEIVAYADSGKAGLQQIQQHDPHVAIVDLEMPDVDGVATIELIVRHYPSTQVLVLSGHDEAQYISKAIKAGAKGYLLKGTASYAIADAIRYVSKGYFHLGSNLLNKLVLDNLGGGVTASQQDIESKLLKPLEQFKREFSDRAQSRIDKEIERVYLQLWDALELKLYDMKNKQSESSHQLKALRQRVHLLTISQIFLLFVILGYMMMNR